MKIGIVSVTKPGADYCLEHLKKLSISAGVALDTTTVDLVLDEVKRVVNAEDWQAMASMILKAIDALKTQGAAFVIIPSNTPHFAFKAFAAQSTLPVLNLIELTAKAAYQQNIKTVAVLGTKQTMSGGLYEPYLQEKGIQSVKIDQALQSDIDSLIKDDLLKPDLDFSNLPEAIKARVDVVGSQIKALDCGGVLLACTELPCVYDERALGMKAIDTTLVLAASAIDRISAPVETPSISGPR
jgi:aspartate racemase